VRVVLTGRCAGLDEEKLISWFVRKAIIQELTYLSRSTALAAPVSAAWFLFGCAGSVATAGITVV
jgi:hypothetical protein